MTAIAAPVDTDRPLARFADVLAWEFCKLRSVPSTRWTLIAAATSNVVLAALAAIFIPSRLSAQDRATTDAVRLSLAGQQIFIAVQHNDPSALSAWAGFGLFTLYVAAALISGFLLINRRDA